MSQLKINLLKITEDNDSNTRRNTVQEILNLIQKIGVNELKISIWNTLLTIKIVSRYI